MYKHIHALWFFYKKLSEIAIFSIIPSTSSAEFIIYPSNAACMAGSLKTSFIPVKNLLYIKVKVTFAVEKTITETSDCKTIPSDCITESSDCKTTTSD